MKKIYNLVVPESVNLKNGSMRANNALASSLFTGYKVGLGFLRYWKGLQNLSQL